MTREIEILDHWFEAYNAHDFAALSQIADPELEIVPLGGSVTAPAGTTYHGHEGLRSLLMPGFERWPGLRMMPGAMEHLGDSVIATLTFVFDDKAGPVTTRNSIVVFRFSDGRIKRISAYETTVEAQTSVTTRRARLLTRREREVVALLAEGMNAEQVAKHLVISPLTVRTHVRNVKDKLGARTTAHVIAIALRDDGF